MTPTKLMQEWKNRIKPEWKVAFWTAVLLGLLVHMPMMLRDIPNHDGLDSMHFDQNMIISGRWFLSIACGISSYYTLPWVIGLLSVVYLGLTAVVLIDFFEIRNKMGIVLVGGLLVTFPALASTFAYVFTMDGYMLALFLAVLAVWITKKKRLGFIAGAVCLAFSMGIYQAYLPFTVILSIYGVLMIAMDTDDIKEKLLRVLHYLYMGGLGIIGYYVILQIMLKIQGKQIGSYQNGDNLLAGSGVLDSIKGIYTDFIHFSIKGNVLMNNVFSIVAMLGLVLLILAVFLRLVFVNKWWKSIWFYLLLIVAVIGLPIGTNIMLLIFPNLTYHVLMRYQWVLIPIIMVAFVVKYGESIEGRGIFEWGVLVTAGILIWNFAVTDQIAYSNLEKKYEKTYAYCIRLLDRIEQTPGYYQGIPIAMIGVIGDESYPQTDITQSVTFGLTGMNGDALIYTGNNYELFMKHYLGATLNILPAESMEEMYYSPEYREMESFPGKDSIKIIDGIMYIKTENQE